MVPNFVRIIVETLHSVMFNSFPKVDLVFYFLSN